MQRTSRRFATMLKQAYHVPVIGTKATGSSRLPNCPAHVAPSQQISTFTLRQRSVRLNAGHGIGVWCVDTAPDKTGPILKCCNITARLVITDDLAFNNYHRKACIEYDNTPYTPRKFAELCATMNKKPLAIAKNWTTTISVPDDGYANPTPLGDWALQKLPTEPPKLKHKRKARSNSEAKGTNPPAAVASTSSTSAELQIQSKTTPEPHPSDPPTAPADKPGPIPPCDSEAPNAVQDTAVSSSPPATPTINVTAPSKVPDLAAPTSPCPSPTTTPSHPLFPTTLPSPSSPQASTPPQPITSTDSVLQSTIPPETSSPHSSTTATTNNLPIPAQPTASTPTETIPTASYLITRSFTTTTTTAIPTANLPITPQPIATPPPALHPSSPLPPDSFLVALRDRNGGLHRAVFSFTTFQTDIFTCIMRTPSSPPSKPLAPCSPAYWVKQHLDESRLWFHTIMALEEWEDEKGPTIAEKYPILLEYLQQYLQHRHPPSRPPPHLPSLSSTHLPPGHSIYQTDRATQQPLRPPPGPQAAAYPPSTISTTTPSYPPQTAPSQTLPPAQPQRSAPPTHTSTPYQALQAPSHPLAASEPGSTPEDQLEQHPTHVDCDKDLWLVLEKRPAPPPTPDAAPAPPHTPDAAPAATHSAAANALSPGVTPPATSGSSSSSSGSAVEALRYTYRVHYQTQAPGESGFDTKALYQGPPGQAAAWPINSLSLFWAHMGFEDVACFRSIQLRCNFVSDIPGGVPPPEKLSGVEEVLQIQLRAGLAAGNPAVVDIFAEKLYKVAPATLLQEVWVAAALSPEGPHPDLGLLTFLVFALDQQFYPPQALWEEVHRVALEVAAAGGGGGPALRRQQTLTLDERSYSVNSSIAALEKELAGLGRGGKGGGSRDALQGKLRMLKLRQAELAEVKRRQGRVVGGEGLTEEVRRLEERGMIEDGEVVVWNSLRLGGLFGRNNGWHRMEEVDGAMRRWMVAVLEGKGLL